MSAALRLLPAKTDVTLLASASRTAAQTGTTQYNHEGAGVILTLAVASITATPGLTVSMGYSYDGGTTWVIFWTAAAAVTTAVTVNYLIYPGILATADGLYTESLNAPLPRIWRITVAVADADEATYALYGQLL